MEMKLTGVPETMLQTLYARAKESKSGRGYLKDPMAEEIVSRMDYDFANADRDRAMYTGVVARTILLDRMTEEFLKNHPGTTVINLACGLDTRCCRLHGSYKMWYNLDLPETMAVRRQFLKETGEIVQIVGSAMDPAWTKQIMVTEGTVLVIIEGLTMYLNESDVKKIFQILDRKFPSAVVFAEVMNPWVVNHIKEKSIEGSSAGFSWGISSGSQLQKMVPPFVSAEDHSLTEGMQVFLPAYRFLGKIRFIRNISNKILVLKK